RSTRTQRPTTQHHCAIQLRAGRRTGDAINGAGTDKAVTCLWHEWSISDVGESVGSAGKIKGAAARTLRDGGGETSTRRQRERGLRRRRCRGWCCCRGQN